MVLIKANINGINTPYFSYNNSVGLIENLRIHLQQKLQLIDGGFLVEKRGNLLNKYLDIKYPENIYGLNIIEICEYGSCPVYDRGHSDYQYVFSWNEKEILDMDDSIEMSNLICNCVDRILYEINYYRIINGKIDYLFYCNLEHSKAEIPNL